MKKLIMAALILCLGIGIANAGTATGSITPTINIDPTCVPAQSNYSPTMNALPGTKPTAVLPVAFTCTSGMTPMLSITTTSQNFNGTMESILSVSAYADASHTVSFDSPQPIRATGTLDSVDVYLEGKNAVDGGPVTISGKFTFPPMTVTFTW